jgi:predicted NAD/FAD-binding protein
MPTRPPRIGILGAGPAGLSLARILSDRGFADVTLLERSNRVGGKSVTHYHQGVGHEMGTCYTSLGYSHVLGWMRQHGVTLHRLPRQQVTHPDGRTEQFHEFVSGPSKLRAAGQLLRYMREYWRFIKWEVDNGPEGPMEHDLATPFGPWLDARGLDAIRRFAVRSMTVMGYGALDTVPALYGLRWTTPSLVISGALVRVQEPVPGWEALWTAMAASLDVRLGCDVREIERGTDGIRVRTDEDTLQLDHLVITTPLDDLPAILTLRDDERAVFDGIRWGRFASALVQADGWFRDRDTNVWLANTTTTDELARARLVGARRTGDKTAVAQSRSSTRPGMYVCYQYAPEGQSEQSLADNLRADIAADGGDVKQIVRHCTWKYPPQLTPNAIRGGGVRKLWALQGQQRTWYSGASLSHEAIDNIVDFNMRLADHMEVTLRGMDAAEGASYLARRRRHHLYSLDNK